MFDRDKWNEIWATITRNKTRSVLTAFGVSWGILMFIVLVGFGNGFKKGVWDELEGFATNSLSLWSGQTSEPYKGNRKGRRWSFNTRDMELVRSKVAEVEYITPMLYEYELDMVRDNKKGTFHTIGIYPYFFDMMGLVDMVYGRPLNEIDIRECRKVCVLGTRPYETFFDKDEDPIGKKIWIKGVYYTVVGVTTSPAMNFGSAASHRVYIPFTVQQRMRNYGDNFWQMMVSAKPGVRMSDIEERIKTIIKENHDISPTDEKAVMSVNIEEYVDMADNVFSGVNLLIWVIGLGALMSGVIGISNIMLVTVRERMREIGIRRALGARPFAIAAQIMSESLVLTTIAGMGGLVFGSLLLIALRNMMTANISEEGLTIVPYISFELAVGAVGILIASGLIAGLMPTWKALKIKAIDAIRDE